MATCFAKTPSDPLVTPSLQEFGIGEGLDSIEGLLANLEGFWLTVVLAMLEENLEGFGMLAEVVEANLEGSVENSQDIQRQKKPDLEVGFGTGVSRRLLLVKRPLPRRPRSPQSPPPSDSPWKVAGQGRSNLALKYHLNILQISNITADLQKVSCQRKSNITFLAFKYPTDLPNITEDHWKISCQCNADQISVFSQLKIIHRFVLPTQMM